MNAAVTATALEKEEALKNLIRGFGSIAVAYSGGVDSTYLADVAHEALGGRACMLIADSPSIPRSEMAEAAKLAKERAWTLTVVETHEFESEAFLKNDGRRCYHCKNELFATMRRYADQNNIAVLAYGETADDLSDKTRVGKLAAQENGVAAPLQEVGLLKSEIRELSAKRGLPTWNKASFACLSSRFPVGMRLEVDEMAKVEQAEEVLKRLGFYQYRARHHGDICRIEIEEQDYPKMLDPAIRAEIVRVITEAGYRFVALDLVGYRTGNMSRTSESGLSHKSQ